MYCFEQFNTILSHAGRSPHHALQSSRNGLFEEIFCMLFCFFNISFCSFTNERSTPTLLSRCFSKSNPNFLPNLSCSK